jgi:hypothetical protein
MRKSIWAFGLVLIAVALSLGACGAGAGSKNPSAAAVESYLKAVVSKDAAKVSALSCKTWESQALLEMDGFQAVKADLDNVICRDTGSDGTATLVACTGNIVLTYNTEKQSLDVSRQTYKVVKEGGDARVCGYQ